MIKSVDEDGREADSANPPELGSAGVREEIDLAKYLGICDEPLTDENDSKEHMIPNALGGR